MPETPEQKTRRRQARLQLKQAIQAAADAGVSPASMQQLVEQIEAAKHHLYRVRWVIDVTARDHIDAAHEAKMALLNQNTPANVFEVTDLATDTMLRIDLDERPR